MFESITGEQERRKNSGKNARKRQYPRKEIFNKAHFLVVFIQSQPLSLVLGPPQMKDGSEEKRVKRKENVFRATNRSKFKAILNMQIKVQLDVM